MAAALLVAAPRADAQNQRPLKFNITVTWDLGLRVGVEYRPWDHLGFIADVGSTLFSLEEDGGFALTYNVFVVVHAFSPQNAFQLSVCLGLPDGRTVFVKPTAGELAFGASIQAAYEITDAAQLFLRVGGGVPIFLEDGSWKYDRPRFLFGLWPDLSLGLKAGLGADR
jgi:hypothetical protein